MRAERKLRILAALQAAGRSGLTDRELARKVGESRSTVAAARRALVHDGMVLQIQAPPGSHYPIAGWRHRDHATHAELRETEREHIEQPALFGAGGSDAQAD